MALSTLFKRKKTPSAAPAAPDSSLDDHGPVQAARARARRRLIGAAVLLALGVIGFPMLFETQPRPLPGNIPIELPRREGVPVSSVPAPPRMAPAVTELPPETEAAPPSAATAAATGAGPASAVPAPSTPASAPLLKAREAQVPATKVAASAPASAPAPSASVPEGSAGRFVVQVGAYTDAGALRDVRAKVERLGLKTYTQSIDTEAGKRTRVRVGPFATRQEADLASSKLKGAGLPGNVLVL